MKRFLDRLLTYIMIIVIGAVVYAVAFCTNEFFKYGELKYEQGYTDAKEFCLQLKRYNYK